MPESPTIVELIILILTALGTYLSRRTDKQVRPSNGKTVAETVEKIDKALTKHVRDKKIHVPPKRPR